MIGRAEQLAEEAVERFLLYLQQQDEVKASAELIDPKWSMLEKAPNLAPYFKNRYWYLEILSMDAAIEKDGSVLVHNIQDNWRYQKHEVENFGIT